VEPNFWKLLNPITVYFQNKNNKASFGILKNKGMQKEKYRDARRNTL